jgi:hypothetical protein
MGMEAIKDAKEAAQSDQHHDDGHDHDH